MATRNEAVGLDAIRAEALFVSWLQRSQRVAAEEVRDAITMTLRLHGAIGCAEAVAEEFGDHPDTAVARMGWALATVHSVYHRTTRRRSWRKRRTRPTCAAARPTEPWLVRIERAADAGWGSPALYQRSCLERGR